MRREHQTIYFNSFIFFFFVFQPKAEINSCQRCTGFGSYINFCFVKNALIYYTIMLIHQAIRKMKSKCALNDGYIYLYAIMTTSKIMFGLFTESHIALHIQLSVEFQLSILIMCYFFYFFKNGDPMKNVIKSLSH